MELGFQRLDAHRLDARPHRRDQCGAAAVERAPITFTAAGESYPLSASQLGVSADWEAAVGEAAAAGGGFGPVRGYKRIQARIFGIDAARTAFERAGGEGLAYVDAQREYAQEDRNGDEKPDRSVAFANRNRRAGRPT